MSGPGKTKIAILGGGVGALTTAWRLTSGPGWQDRYDIMVYQLGWRLGGKGASGRRGPHGRIEEHGLHIWLGFYRDAFRMMQTALEELNPGTTAEPAAAPGGGSPRIAKGVFLRCEDAFQPHSYVGVDMLLDGQWSPWMVDFPTTDEKPWDASGRRSLWQLVREGVRWLADYSRRNRHVHACEQTAAHAGLRAWLKEHAEHLVLDVETLEAGVLFSADLQTIPSRYAASKAYLGPVILRTPLLIGFLVSVATCLGLWWFLKRRPTGRRPHPVRRPGRHAPPRASPGATRRRPHVPDRAALPASHGA